MDQNRNESFEEPYLFGEIQSENKPEESRSSQESIHRAKQMNKPETKTSTKTSMIFKNVLVAIKQHPDLSAAAKFGLETELRKLQQQLAMGQDAKKDALVQHMANIHRISPSIWKKLLQQLHQRQSTLVQPILEALQIVEETTGRGQS